MKKVESKHLKRRSTLMPMTMLVMMMFNPSHESRADTYVTTEGDTIVITNQPDSKQKKRGRVINKSHREKRSRRDRTCYLENRETNEKVLTTNPSKRLLRNSHVIWCENSSSILESGQKSAGSNTGKGKPKRSLKNRNRGPSGGRLLPKRAARFKGFVSEAAKKYTLPEALLWAFMKVESDFVPTAVSRKGAQGLMQLMPLTAKDMGVTDPFDPQQNIFGAAKLIGILMKRFNRELPLVISAYHAGGGAVTRREGIPYSETSQYMTSVLNAYYRYMGNPPYVREKK